MFRRVIKANRAGSEALNPESINQLVQAAVARADLENASAYRAHSLRAGFVTYAHLRGASDRAIAHQTATDLSPPLVSTCGFRRLGRQRSDAARTLGGRASVACASNAPFSEWGRTFTDPRLAAAVVDRLTFRAHIIETGTNSYRLRQARAAKGARKPKPDKEPQR